MTRAGDLIDKLRVASAQVNWVKTQQMHLTLKFLGDVPDTETPDICRVVAGVARQFEPFEITLRGAGAFPTNEHPRTIWIGIEDGAERCVPCKGQSRPPSRSSWAFPRRLAASSRT